MNQCCFFFVGKCYSYNGIFRFSINEINVVFAYMVESTSSLYHARLGHLNYRYLKAYDDNDKCKVCIQVKITKSLFSKVERNSQLLELVHSNICEIIGMLTKGGKIYFITFINDYSHFIYVYLLRPKD
jgi:hypothetical protein